MAERLLRYGLLREYGRAGEKILKSPLGKPYLLEKSIRISTSHCQGAVAVILSQHEVGIDIERIRSFEKEAARRVLTDREMQTLESEKGKAEEIFFRYWTLKESYIKALGTGLTYPLKNLSLMLEGNEILSNKPWATFHFVQDCEGFIISVCHLHGKGLEESDLCTRRFTIP